MNHNILPDNSNKSAFEFSVVELQKHRVLLLSGEIDVHTVHQFKEAVTGILDRNIDHLIVDMQNVHYVDSSGLGVFVSSMKQVNSSGKTLNLVGCSPRIEHMFCITHLSSFIALHENMEDALKAITV